MGQACSDRRSQPRENKRPATGAKLSDFDAFCRYGFSNISRRRSEHVAAQPCAGTEAFARAGEHDRPGTIVGERRFERRPEIGQPLFGDCVVLLGIIQRQDRYRSALLRSDHQHIRALDFSQLTARVLPSQNGARSSRLRILPAPESGNVSSRMSTLRGHL